MFFVILTTFFILVFSLWDAGRTVVWRMLNGFPLDGKRRTNCTFLYPGTASLDPSGVASKWALLPGYKRALCWLLSAIAIILLCVGFARYRTWTVAGLVITSLISIAIALKWLIHEIIVYQHKRTVIYPLHRALAREVGQSASVRHEQWIDVPRDYKTDKHALVRITLPQRWGGSDKQKARVEQIVTYRLGGADEWEAEFNTNANGNPVLELRRIPTPPDLVTYADMRECLETEAQEHLVPIGKDVNGDPFIINVDNDSPHVMFSCPPGGGKSNVIRIFGGHGSHFGCRVDLLNAKKSSHHWIDGLPGTRHVTEVEDLHNYLLELLEEIRSRYDQLKLNADLKFQRIFLLIDEQNILTSRLQSYWRTLRRTTDRSPAIEAFEELILTGREAKLTVVSAAQMGTARAYADPAVRESFFCRILGRYSEAHWKMLVGTDIPMPPVSEHEGRFVVVLGHKATSIQLLLGEKKCVRQYATNGIPQPRTAPKVPSFSKSQANGHVNTDKPPIILPPPPIQTSSTDDDPTDLLFESETGLDGLEERREDI